jgi:N-acetylglucosamine kinase-like BadF-type ATPase
VATAVLATFLGSDPITVGATPEQKKLWLSRIADEVPAKHFWIGMVKAPVFALVLAVIACKQGLSVGGDVNSLGRHVTASVVQSIFIDHDARTALAGAIPSMTGVIAISGTGSIAFAMNANGASARAGGWGYLLGDPGSAYEIGRHALAAVALAHDGAGPVTTLSSLLLQALNIQDAAEITQVIYRDASPKLRIAGVCPTVAAAAASGDAVALSIFEEAGRGLGSMACAAEIPSIRPSASIRRNRSLLNGSFSRQRNTSASHSIMRSNFSRDTK